MELRINGRVQTLDADPAMPLAWALRDLLNLTGTKIGCAIGACGACTVHVDGRAQRACVLPLSAVAGREVRTIEALGAPGAPHPLQQAWIAHQVPQCGWCQGGVLMTAAALLAARPDPSDAEIDAAIANTCRCGTTPRMRAALREAAAALRPAARAKKA